jgi:hypothetical protein
VENRDSSVSIVTRLLAEQQTNRGSIPDMEFFSSPKLPDRYWSHPASYSVAIGDPFHWGKTAAGLQICHSPASSVEDKN